jgi:3-oxoacyl-[acyl-carrier protein] reductase
MSEQRLAGKRALVTGGGRGIGAAIVRKLVAEGAEVAVNYVADAASASALVDELTSDGHRVHAFQADVSDPAQTSHLVEQVTDQFGGLDLLASNAGVEHFGALETITLADFERVFRINVAGQLFAAQAAAAAMGEWGRIVLTSSVSARIAVHQHTLYAASKAAVSAMVLNLAPELATRHIAINAIAPGGTATDMAVEHAAEYIHPALTGVPTEAVIGSMNALGRLAEPSEIAAVVAFLLSSDASYLTGATVDISGGWI